MLEDLVMKLAKLFKNNSPKDVKSYNADFSHLSSLKLHLGCGNLYKEGWVNIDNNSDNNIKKLDINYNMENGIPFDDSSVDYIYHEHFIEHLSYEDGEKLLKESYRVLKDNGVMRVACPDLDDLIDSYLKDDWREQEWVEKYGYEWIPSRCYMINMCMNEQPWGHKYVYNQEDLVKQLKNVGFTKVDKKDYRQSSFEDLQSIDTRTDSMIFEVKK